MNTEELIEDLSEEIVLYMERYDSHDRESIQEESESVKSIIKRFMEKNNLALVKAELNETT